MFIIVSILSAILLKSIKNMISYSRQIDVINVYDKDDVCPLYYKTLEANTQYGGCMLKNANDLMHLILESGFQLSLTNYRI